MPMRCLPALAVLLAGTSLPAQGTSRSAAFVLLRGADTVVIERMHRTDTAVTAVVTGRASPRLTLVHRLDASHRITGTTFNVYGPNTPPDAAPLQSGTVTMDGDTAVVTMRASSGDRVMKLPRRPGAMIVVNNDFTTLEQAVRMARAQGVTRLAVPLWALTGGVNLEATLDLRGDTARFTIAGNVTEVLVDAAGNVTGGMVPAASVRIAVVEGPAAASIGFGAPDYSAPAGAPYLAEEVSVSTPAGHTLAGTLTRPRAAPGRLPAVVTITGSGAQDRDETIPIVSGYALFRQVADTLSRRGIAVLRLDDRGVGGSGGDVNGTSADFADDVRAAVAYLRQRADIDPARIALVGHSEGGLIAPMVAASDARIAGIVLMAGPAWTGRRIIDYQLAQAARADTSHTLPQRDSAHRALVAQFDSTTAKAPWMRWFLSHDPLPVLRGVRQPVLVLQGATDRQVTAAQAAELERALRAAGNRNVATHVFADRNHLFLRDPDGSPTGYVRLSSGRVDGEVLGALADWLATLLAR